MADLSRRDFLAVAGAAAASASGLLLPSGFAWAAGEEQDFWAKPRRLRLYRPQTRESVNEVYWADGALSHAGYARISNFLRDARANEAVWMDTRLLDLICAVQGYMAYYGFVNPLVIHSGYRSPRTNDRTEGAAKKSMHLRGRAVDFSMPGVPSNYLGALASHYQGGGVGFYPGNGFTHMDTGSVRYWGNGGGKRPPGPQR
jgi:uncharacterized protein YcbK (DUF882 family)